MWGVGCRVKNGGFGVQGVECRVQGVGRRVQGVGYITEVIGDVWPL